MKQLIKDVLDDMSNGQVNLESEASRELISNTIMAAIKTKGGWFLDLSTFDKKSKLDTPIYEKTDEGEPVEFFWVEWRSDLYWYLGDTLGYIINRHLNDSGNYVSVDTSYMIGFNGMEVPTSNIISYSNSYGEINNMIAPVRSMIGDTLTLTAIWYNSEKRFGIVLDQEKKCEICDGG